MAEDVQPNPGCLTQNDNCYGSRQDNSRPIDYHDGTYCCGTIVKDEPDLNSGDINPESGESTYKKLCLTDSGLAFWQGILGTNYGAWLNSYGENTDLYGCDEISQLEEIQLNENDELYTTDCEYTTTSKVKAQKEIAGYQKTIEELTKENEAITQQINELESQTIVTTVEAPCTSYVDLFENFDVSFALEVLSGNTYVPVYEETIFNIGSGNIWDYITSSSGNTGIIIGDPNVVLNDGNTDVKTRCSDELTNPLVSEVSQTIPEDELEELKEDPERLNELLYGWWDSCWLRFEANICNDDIIDKIVNREINMVFNINNSCADFQIMLDRVKLTKTCQKTINEETFISEPPKFEITRVIDNKKSWVALDTKDERFYDLKYRPTEYDVNHHKLVVNTKEIDLNLSPARAVEQDVWCYMNDNNILSCTGFTGSTLPVTGDCGDICIDLSGKLSTDLAEIDSVEEFTNVIYTELIDAKNRQTISAYPTLKLLYERYNYNALDFSNYQSSQYDYFDMDNFGQNVNNYWVDLIEQVVPATTIWESTYEYRNTVFDTQKYKYRHNNIYWEKDPSDSFPFSAVSNDTSVSVIVETLPNEEEPITEEEPVVGDDTIIITPPDGTVPDANGDITIPDPIDGEEEPVVVAPAPPQSTPTDIVEENKRFEKLVAIDQQYTIPPIKEVSGVWEMQHTCSPEFLGTVNVIRNNNEENNGDTTIITIGDCEKPRLFNGSYAENDEGGGLATFDLTSTYPDVAPFDYTTATFEWYTDSGLTTPIISTSSYSSPNAIIYVRVTNSSGCDDVASLRLIVN